MADEDKTRERLEIAHVLFIDIVGYSRLLVHEQGEALHDLNARVRNTEAVRAAEAAGQLVLLPTGDGIALVFTSSVEAPAECALELAQAMQARPSPPLRMGIHSGPVQHIHDVNGRANIAGGGINIAQRVMDCGDAGHILVSKRVADDLAGSRRWQPYLHEIGDVEVKHGLVVSLVNLYAEAVGNPARPGLLGLGVTRRRNPSASRRLLVRALFLALALLALALWWQFVQNRVGGSVGVSGPTAPSTPAVAPPLPDLPMPEKSVAVLPFESLSADKENAYFADGVQDEVLTNLAKVADLKVISRTSVMQYREVAKRNLREVGRQLGVAHVLEGSVQRSGNKVRVNAQLIDTRTDAHLWAEHYDRPLDDVFAIQSEIAEAIAGQLKARLSPEEKSAINARPTTDLEAYDLYLRAQALRADSTNTTHATTKLPQAARALEDALARDPNFLLAWCELAKVHGYIFWQGIDHTPARLEQVRAAVETAARLGPDAGEPHVARSNYYYQGFRDYERARVELDLARRTLPNSAEIYERSGYIDRRQGRWTESVRNLERALELDPRNFFIMQQQALTYQQLHRYDEQARVLDRALTVIPGDPNTRIIRAAVAIDKDADVRPFRATLAALLAENPDNGPAVEDPMVGLCERTPAAAARLLANYPAGGIANNGTNYPHAYWEGVLARWQGDAARARAAFTAARAGVAKIVEEQPGLASAVSLLGIIDAGLGNKDQAIAEGRRACELLPISEDASDGASLAANLAQIYAWSGDKKAAVEQIAAVQTVPNLLTYGHLKLHPLWEDLRGDPPFEALVASLAPKP